MISRRQEIFSATGFFIPFFGMVNKKPSPLNPKSTGLFSPGTALLGGGVFSVKLDPDVPES